MKLMRVGVLSAAKVATWSGVIYGVFLGLIYGNLVGFAQLAFMPGVSGQEAQAWRWAMVGAWVVGLGLLMALFGFLHGLVGSLFLNLVLRITGGLELEVEPRPVE